MGVKPPTGLRQFGLEFSFIMTRRRWIILAMVVLALVCAIIFFPYLYWYLFRVCGSRC
jgi:hypothetical protein